MGGGRRDGRHLGLFLSDEYLLGVLIVTHHILKTDFLLTHLSQ